MKYKLQDLIDIAQFQNIQDRLNEIYSFPSAIIDNEGIILTATAWQDVCTQFHRKNKDSEQDCIQSDQYIMSHLHEANPAVSYRCPRGLVDNATPIIIDGIHYGNFFTGQFFLENPDMEFFQAQAKRYGFDEGAYLAAVKKVPIWTREQLNSYLFFIKGLIAIISESGLKTLKETETRKEIEESEARHRAMLQTAMDGIWRVDRHGRLLEVNETYCRMSGYNAQELLAMRIPDLDAAETPDAATLHIQKIMEQGEDRFESRHHRKDGTIYDVEISVQYRPTEEGFVAFIRDITERKRLEAERLVLLERLNRSEKMEALGTLAGGVAHDMNNVLGVLSGYSELLQEGIPEGSPLKPYVKNVLAASEKGAAIIQDLLTLARRGVTASAVVNINAIIVDFLKSPLYEKIRAYHPEVQFTTDLASDLLNIKGSAVHLEKTVMNLTSNAAEAISGRGKVTIRTENRYLDKALRDYSAVKEGDYVVLTVSDTGGGIPSSDLDKIFEPFYTKKKMGRSGTGLGLSIVWGTVKDHEGYIDVESITGQGSTFTLSFPVTREARGEEAQKVPIEQYTGHGEMVLVVDDVSEQRGVATSILTLLGYTVHAVSSGEEAVEYLQSNTVDILVLDMIMNPGIDGLETYQRVIKINPQQKAIIVSGFSETERVRKAQELGVGAYVKKPYLKEKIGMAVRQELDRK